MRRVILLVMTPALLAPAAALGAQRALSVGIAGGVSMPTGDLGDGVNTGWRALGTLALGSLMQPLGLRLDAAYDRFGFNDRVLAAAGGSGHLTVGSATLNVTYRLPTTNSPLSPYLITGLGAYRTACSLGEGCGGATHYGWNVGIGSKLLVLGLRSFVEARYHRTGRGGSDVHFFPVTVGLLF